jgi:DNA-binding XRE family transcriptional regulator
MKEKTKLMKKIIERGVTFSQIADKLSDSKIRATTVFQWADGRKVPSEKMKKALAKALDCKVSDIF